MKCLRGASDCQDALVPTARGRAAGAKTNFLSLETLFEKMTIRIIVSESWRLEANWEHEGANVTQIILYPAGEHCPFMMDRGKLYYDRPWLN